MADAVLRAFILNLFTPVRQGLVMVNFMFQFGWAIVPRYVPKHYSGCVHEDVFG